MNEKTYKLRELADIDIDAWVEGISAVDDKHHDEAKRVKGEDFDCPAEAENELTAIANKNGYRFTRKGELVIPKVKTIKVFTDENEYMNEIQSQDVDIAVCKYDTGDFAVTEKFGAPGQYYANKEELAKYLAEQF